MVAKAPLPATDAGCDVMATPRPFLEALRLVALKPNLPDDFEPTQRRHFERLRGVLSDPNVVGVGVAEKRVGDEGVGTLALTFYVREKRARDDMRGAVPVPTVVASPSGRALFTDVFEIGEVLPQAAIERTPIESGYSVAHRASGPGTLGAIVNWFGEPAILSNAHVLARSGTAALDDAILYPAAADGGRDPQDRIGSLANFKAFQSGGAYVNRFDAALATIAAARLPDLDRTIPGAAQPHRWAVPRRGMKVRITGRSSLASRAVVRDENATVQLMYADVGLVGFYGQCLCDAYTGDGDSGAVVIDDDTGDIVGLHFAASDKGSYFSPIKPIMDALKFTF
jgi:hypothetical protein